MRSREALGELLQDQDALTTEQVETLEWMAQGMMWSEELDQAIQGLAHGLKAYFASRTLAAYTGEEERDDNKPFHVHVCQEPKEEETHA
jgi:hypothetical protein